MKMYLQPTVIATIIQIVSQTEDAKQKLTERMRNLYQKRNVDTSKNKHRKGRTKEREIAQNAYIARSVGRAEM